METKTEEPKQDELKLPVLDAPGLYLDDKTGMAWLGIPTKGLAPFMASVLLDHMKLKIVQFTDVMKRRSNLISPVREGIGNMMKRLST